MLNLEEKRKILIDPKTTFLFINKLPSKKNKEIFENIKISLKNNLDSNKILKNMKITEEFIKKNYPIQTGLNNPILRKKSVEIKEIDEETKNFWKILLKAMRLYDGIWLAAPQIWINKRIIAVCQLDKKEKNIIFSDVLVNPKIIEKSTKKFIQEEACLSLPWLEWDVERSLKIKLIYQDLEGKKHELNAKWLNAAIIQHELDHLDWILFWDKVKDKELPDMNKLLNFTK